MVGVGTREAYLAIRADDQLENRFAPLTLPRWETTDDACSLLASFAAAFPLRRPSPIATAEMTRSLEAEQQHAAAIIEAPQPASEPVPTGRGPACPTCDYRPTDSRELELHRDGLATIWLTLDPDDPERIIERRHCERCQPHRARIVMCGLFDTTVMLGDDLAVPEPSPLPRQAVHWLTTNVWKQHRGDWYCDNHAEGQAVSRQPGQDRRRERSDRSILG